MKYRTLAILTGLLVGCSTGTEEPDLSPKIQALDKDSYAVGEVMEFHGTNFLDDDEGTTWVRFNGTFTAADGSTTAVDFEAPTVKIEDESGEKIVWQRFGPFSNPFTDAGVSGTFSGEIVPVNKFSDGQEQIGLSEVREVGVDPSLEIVELQPVFADCGMPALNGFGGIPYRMTVRAAGFAPDQFDYRISGLANPDLPLESQTETLGFTEFGHEATGRTDTLDVEDNIIFIPPPIGTKYYVANIQVRARDAASGNYIDTYLPFEIHRPLEVSYNGSYEIAETYEPHPVSACIPGAIGNRATYSETETEVRQQTISISFSNTFTSSNGVSATQDWQEGYGTTDSISSTQASEVTNTNAESASLTSGQTYNESEANDFSFGTTDGETWNSQHSAGGSVGAEGGAGIPLVAEGKVSVEANYNYTWGSGGSRTESRNFGNTHTQSSGNSLSESYTLSSSNSESSSFSDTESRAESRTYNFGASATTDSRVSEGMSEAESNTWSRSESYSTLTSYSGFIPVDQFGVFYRQTIRMVRRAYVVKYNACGVGEPAGQILMNEWNWAPDLAVGESCDSSLPPSNLPPAKCHIPPCN